MNARPIREFGNPVFNVLVNAETGTRGSQYDVGTRAFLSRQWEFEQVTQGAVIPAVGSVGINVKTKHAIDSFLEIAHITIGDYLARGQESTGQFVGDLSVRDRVILAAKYVALESVFRGKRRRRPITKLLLDDTIVRHEIEDAEKKWLLFQSAIFAKFLKSHFADRRAATPEDDCEYTSALAWVQVCCDSGLGRTLINHIVGFYLDLESIAWHQGAERCLADLVMGQSKTKGSPEVERVYTSALEVWDL